MTNETLTQALEAVDAMRARLAGAEGALAEHYRGLVDDAERYLLRAAHATPTVQSERIFVATHLMNFVHERLEQHTSEHQRRQQAMH